MHILMGLHSRVLTGPTVCLTPLISQNPRAYMQNVETYLLVEVLDLLDVLVEILREHVRRDGRLAEQLGGGGVRLGGGA